MPEPPAGLDQPEQRCPGTPRRVITDWEYQTAYIKTFQVRITAELNDWLSEWAKQERKPQTASSSQILEEAVVRRGSVKAFPSSVSSAPPRHAERFGDGGTGDPRDPGGGGPSIAIIALPNSGMVFVCHPGGCPGGH